MKNNTLDIEEAYQTMYIRIREEVEALPWNKLEVARLLGCQERLLHSWMRGPSHPSAYYILRLYHLGCDIVYILTGKHTQGGDLDV